ncbi:hypothetical protein GP486_006042, partial [Trichoglossum hirsutum]
MRLAYYLLPLAAATAAFMIPDEEILRQIELEAENPGDPTYEEVPSVAPDGPFSSFVDYSEDILDSALSFSSDADKKAQKGY